MRENAQSHRRWWGIFSINNAASRRRERADPQQRQPIGIRGLDADAI
jgi:hypothetical protein